MNTDTDTDTDTDNDTDTDTDIGAILYFITYHHHCKEQQLAYF